MLMRQGPVVYRQRHGSFDKHHLPGGKCDMGKLELGLYDVFTHAAMDACPTPADVYDEHLRCAQEAEQLGYKYYGGGLRLSLPPKSGFQ